MQARQQQIHAVRQRVLLALKDAGKPISGRDASLRAGLPYKPTIDALTALNNQGKVWRIGRKLTAMWTAEQPRAEVERAATHLNALFRS